jgi:acetyl esterase/lipase
MSTIRAGDPLALEEKNLRVELAEREAVDVRVYGRRRPGSARPLVVHFHGGAFVAGDLDSGATVARLLAHAGAVVVSMAYPLAPRHPFPDGVEAGYALLGWVYKNRVKLAGQGARVFLAGEEAGGNIAAALSVISRDRGHPPVVGQVLLSPMLDPCVASGSQREAMAGATTCAWSEGWKKYLRCPMDAEHPYAVPSASSRLASLPPTLVLSGLDDPLHDEAKAYAGRLRTAGIDATYRALSSAQNWPQALTEPAHEECACGAEVVKELRAFFNQTTPGQSAGSEPPDPGTPAGA